MSKSFTESINQTGISKGINGLFGAPSKVPETTLEKQQTIQQSITPIRSNVKKERRPKIRASFHIGLAEYEKLKDFVYYSRISGRTNFTQSDGIEKALQLLFKSVENLPTRPPEVQD